MLILGNKGLKGSTGIIFILHEVLISPIREKSVFFSSKQGTNVGCMFFGRVKVSVVPLKNIVR